MVSPAPSALDKSSARASSFADGMSARMGRDGFSDARLGAPIDDDARVFGGQSFGNGETDAGSGTADKGEFIFELEIHGWDGGYPVTCVDWIRPDSRSGQSAVTPRATAIPKETSKNRCTAPAHGVVRRGTSMTIASVTQA